MNSAKPELSPRITGIILAGGAGQRMGGADKGLLSLQGRPLIEHVIDTLSPQVDDILVVANRNSETYAEFGYPVIPDPLPDHPGPLVGMLAGLNACKTELALFVPVDAPALPQNLGEHLLQAGDANPTVAADAHDWQPLCCLLPTALISGLENVVAQGERSPKAWLQSLAPTVVSFASDELVWSVNTPEELAALEQHPGLAA